MAISLLELPAELLNNILSYLQAKALLAYGHSCTEAHKFINAKVNPTLWKRTFLNTYDPLPSYSSQNSILQIDANSVNEYDYFSLLRLRATIVRRITAEEEFDSKDDHTEAVSTLLSMIGTAKPKSSPGAPFSLNLDVLIKLNGRPNLERIIHARHIDVSGPVTRSTMLTQEQPDNTARLHVLYGLTKTEKDAPRLRGIARRLVYDWSLTSAETDFGPFKLDGSGEVNWQLVEAACSTISRNFSKCADGRIVIPQGFENSIPYRTLPDPASPEDWAGVRGTFVGTYAFLDYADLHFFNIGRNNGQLMTLEDEREACGDLMSLELKLDPGLASDSALKTNLPVCNTLPVLYFTGLSIGFDGAYRPAIGVRGTASLVPGGREVRWRFLITYGGEDQWQLEGVQAGGIRSGGVYGIWSHVGHAPHGPTGPFCYFPLEICKRTD